LIAYSWFIMPYAARASALGGTAVLKFHEEKLITLDVLAGGFGGVVIALAAAGMILSFRHHFHRERERFLLGWFAGLLLFFCLLDYVYRAGAIILFKENFTAFTPSRFLAFMGCPLVIFAGFGLKNFIERISKRLPVKYWRIIIPAFGLIAIVCAIPVIAKTAAKQAIRPEVIKFARIMRESTPENAFIFDRLQLTLNERCWLCYLTWRQTLLSPVLASENRKKVYEEKLFYLENNFKSPEKIEDWMNKRELECYMFTLDRQGNGQMIKLFRRR